MVKARSERRRDARIRLGQRVVMRIVMACAISIVALCTATVQTAFGDPSPSPAATPAPNPTFRPIVFAASLNTVFLTQGASGPGLQPVEGPSFAAGGLAAPVSPYDPLTGAPMVPGNVGQNQISLTALWTARAYHGGADLSAESLFSDRTN